MKGRSSSKSAILGAGAVCITLLGIFVFVSVYVGYASFDTTNLFQISVIIIITLVTIIVYQSVRLSTTAQDLAEDMAKDILLYSHELFSELYRGSPVPYILINEEGIVTSTNPSTVRLFNCSQGELDGKNIFEFIDGDNEQRVALIPEKLKQGLFVSDAEVRIRRFDDATRWVLLSLFSFKDSKEERNGLLTLVDITKQKEIDKAKSEFVSLASHQLRTPISSMKWSLELLSATPLETLTALQKDYIGKLANAVNRMENLISDFLSVSKFELGTLVAEKKPAVLQDCITDLLDEQYEKARARSIEVRTDLPEAPVDFRTDTHLFGMATGNLLSNAIKYTPSGGTVLIRCLVDNDHLVVAVSDTGMGIPANEQDKLFSKIFRATNARTQVPDGTGLGLYIAKEAVTVLGGTISCVSKENVGTTFTMVFPLV